MKIRNLALGAALATLIGLPSLAEAATWQKAWFGLTTGTVNLRVAASSKAPKILTIYGVKQVQIIGKTNKNGGWYQVVYKGQAGFVSDDYVRTQLASNGPMMHGPAPTHGYFKKPYWDNQHQAWYDGHRWYRNGIWYNSPSGFSFGFNFGG